MDARVLLVDDDRRMLDLVEHELGQAGFATVTAADGTTALELLESEEPDVVVLDLNLPDISGFELLERARATHPDLPVVVLTAHGEVDAVVRCMRLGAVDYVQKPFDRTRLVTSVRNARARGRLEVKVRTLTEELRAGEGFGRLIGASPAMERAVGLLRRASDSEVTVLVTGESGTGKEVAARALHAESGRRTGPFVAINCGAIPEGLIESELFGHAKGAFTGATEKRAGRFEQADGGTLFLDEIGELRLDLQVRLLRVLQERQIQRLGGTGTRPVDVRVIAATNRDLKAEAVAGRFREDLYYRLAVFPVSLPPLREREGDVHLLADTFVGRFAARHRRALRGITPEASRALGTYDWPGNVRELENVLERAVILEDREAVSLGSLPDEIVGSLCGDADITGSPLPPRELPEPALARPRTAQDIRPLADEERRIISEALEVTGWNVVQAARRLGIGRATIYRKIERYGLDRDRAQDGTPPQ